MKPSSLIKPFRPVLDRFWAETNIKTKKYVDLFVSNQDVMRAKPFPEMYWKCMTLLNALPRNTVIIEDSEVGIQGARDSGAHFLEVESRKDVNQSLVLDVISVLQ